MSVGSVARDFQEAQAMVVPVLVPLILFCGYVIPLAQIPPAFKFLYHASFFQYAFGTMEVRRWRRARRAKSRDISAAASRVAR